MPACRKFWQEFGPVSKYQWQVEVSYKICLRRLNCVAVCRTLDTLGMELFLKIAKHFASVGALALAVLQVKKIITKGMVEVCLRFDRELLS